MLIIYKREWCDLFYFGVLKILDIRIDGEIIVRKWWNCLDRVFRVSIYSFVIVVIVIFLNIGFIIKDYVCGG